MIDPTMKDIERDGEWGAVINDALIQIHAMVLPDGKVLAFGTDGTSDYDARFVYSLYDPATGEHKVLPNTTGTNIFCSNMSIDPATGNVIIMGGDNHNTGEGGGTWSGRNDVVVFDYEKQEIRNLSDEDPAFALHQARWYGTTVNLANGEILMLGGRDENFNGSTIPEIYNSETGMRQLKGAEMLDFLDGDGTLTGTYYYAHAWQMSDGSVIVIEAGGPNHDVYRMDVSGEGQVEKIAELPFDTRNLTSSIMYAPDKVIVASDNGQVWKADLSLEVPRWEIAFTITEEDDPDDLIARTNGTFAMMPDGRVAMIGGSSSAGLLADSLGNAQKSVFFWDPETGETAFSAPQDLARMYHSTGLLLPTGQLYSGGSGSPGPQENTNFQILTPDYLFDENGNYDEDRPQILRAPKNVESGTTIRLTVDDTADIGKVSFIKSGAATHARNADTRFIALDYTVLGDTTIEVNIPEGKYALPGLWMLFVVDKDGTPSIASLTGVDMAEITGSAGLGANPTTMYNIDDEQIDGAFALAVTARFDDLEGGQNQRVFDLGNGNGGDGSIWLGQVGASNDMEFVLVQDGVVHRIVAQDAIVAGEEAIWRVGIDPDGVMRITKDGAVLAEGQGVVPADIERSAYLVGEAQDGQSDVLIGLVRDLKIANYGNLAELDPAAEASPCATTGEAVCLCNKLVPDVDDTPDNDAPKVFDDYSVLNGTITELEDGSPGENTTVLTRTGILAFADADESDVHTVAVTPKGTDYLGAFTVGRATTTEVAKTGSVTWNFEVGDAALDALKAGERLVQTYDVTITDPAGLSTTRTIAVTLVGVDDSTPSPDDYIVVEELEASSGDDIIVLGDNIRLMEGEYFSGGQNSLTVGDYFELKSGLLDFDNSDGSASFITGLRPILNGGDIRMDEGNITNTLVLGNVAEFSFIKMDGNGGDTVNSITIGNSSASDAGIDIDTYGSASNYADVSLTTGNVVKIGGAIDADGSYTNKVLSFGRLNTIEGPIYLGGVTNNDTVLTADVKFTVAGAIYGSAAGRDLYTIGDDWDIDGPVYLYGGDDVLTLGTTTNDTTLTYFFGGAGRDTLNLSVNAADFAEFEAAAEAIGWEKIGSGEWEAKARDLRFKDMYFYDFEAVNVTVVGGNAAPTIVVSGTVAEGGVSELEAGDPDAGTFEHLANGTIEFTDTDPGDTHTVTIVPDGENYIGEMRYTQPKSAQFGLLPWVFAVEDAALDNLAEGEVVTQTYTVTLTDQDGASVQQTITITLTGAGEDDTQTNRAPVIDATVSDLVGTVDATAAGADGEDTVLHSQTGTIAYSDPDADQTHTATVAPQGEAYRGTLTLGSPTDGALGWTFAVEDGALDDLAEGEVVTQAYTVTLTDQDGASVQQTITITLTGAGEDDTQTNRAPVIDATISDLVGTVDEPAAGADGEDTVLHSQTGTIAYSDPDADQTHTATVAPQGEAYRGTLTLGSPTDGALGWTFAVEDAALDDLAEGEVVTQAYTITLTDQDGASVQQTITITLTGAGEAGDPGSNTAPVASDDAVWFPLRADEVVTGETDFMLFNDTDPDGDPLEVVSVKALSARGAAVTLRDTDGDGTFDSLDYDPTVSSELVALERGRELEDRVEYTIADDKGATDSATIYLTVEGTAEPTLDDNTAPVASDDDLWFSLSADEVVTGETDFMLFNDTDPDGDPLEVVSVKALSARGAAVALRDTTGDGVFDAIDYDPTVSSELVALERGSQIDDQVEYTISDGRGGTDTATIALTIDGTAEPIDPSAGSLDQIAFADLDFGEEAATTAAGTPTDDDMITMDDLSDQAAA